MEVSNNFTIPKLDPAKHSAILLKLHSNFTPNDSQRTLHIDSHPAAAAWCKSFSCSRHISCSFFFSIRALNEYLFLKA